VIFRLWCQPCCVINVSGFAWHYGYTVTQIIEKLAAGAERVVEARLSGRALEQYRAGGYGTNNRFKA
jgi:hypothetical protein